MRLSPRRRLDPGRGAAPAAPITWYDMLGIGPGASAETVRRACQHRGRQLDDERLAGAPPNVVDAAARGWKALGAAWLVLSDRAARERYDAGIALASGLRPPSRRRWRRRRPRPVTAPDVRGLFFGSCNDALARAGFHVRAVRLTEDPMPVEGLVVDQWPAPGESMPLPGTLTVHVWHPPRPPAGPAPA
jgi:hypothetical protein